MAVLALFIETIDGIAYFAIAVRGFFQNLHKKLDKPQLIPDFDSSQKKNERESPE